MCIMHGGHGGSASCPTEARYTKTRGATPAAASRTSQQCPFFPPLPNMMQQYTLILIYPFIIPWRCMMHTSPQHPVSGRIISGQRTAGRGRRRPQFTALSKGIDACKCDERGAVVINVVHSSEKSRHEVPRLSLLFTAVINVAYSTVNAMNLLRRSKTERENSSDKRGAQFSAYSKMSIFF